MNGKDGKRLIVVYKAKSRSKCNSKAITQSHRELQQSNTEAKESYNSTPHSTYLLQRGVLDELHLHVTLLVRVAHCQRAGADRGVLAEVVVHLRDGGWEEGARVCEVRILWIRIRIWIHT